MSVSLLDELLAARIAKFRREIFVTLAWVALGLLFLSVMGLLFMRDATTSLAAGCG